MNQQRIIRPATRPIVTIATIAVCVTTYLIGNLFPDWRIFFLEHFALWPLYSDYFQPWQLFSYGFLHGGFNHLFFNMFALWMFGLPVERSWGSKKFAEYLFICLLGAGLIQLLVQYLGSDIYPTIGASGAVFGLLLAYGVTWPNNKLFLIFLPVPIKAKWFVLIYGAVELIFGVTGAMPQVAHYAHLGGLLFGAGLLWRWGWRPRMTWN